MKEVYQLAGLQSDMQGSMERELKPIIAFLSKVQKRPCWAAALAAPATQRLWSWRAEFGSATWWSRRLGEAVCREGADQLWPSMVDGALAVP